MKAWFLRCSIASAVLLAVACGDDDSSVDGADAGQGGEPGSAAGSGGSAGSHAGSGGAAGSDASDAGAGGVPAPTCAPPEPPLSGEGGAGSSGGASESDALAIIGAYEDSFGGEHVVTGTAWTSASSVYHVSAFDNEARWLIARNDENNLYSPCLWSRFDWAEVDSKLYFCQTAYDAPSETFARELEAPDPSDPSKTGCAGFPWSELSPQ